MSIFDAVVNAAKAAQAGGSKEDVQKAARSSLYGDAVSQVSQRLSQPSQQQPETPWQKVSKQPAQQQQSQPIMQPVAQQPSASRAATSTPKADNDFKENATKKQSKKEEAKQTSAPGTNADSNGNGSFLDIVMNSVMQNPDTQAIMQNPINALVPQSAFASNNEIASSGFSNELPDTTDPNALAMPSGEQMQQLTPEEQQQWHDTNAPIADFLISNMLTPGIGGLAGNAIKGLMTADRVKNAGVAATKAAANTAGRGVKASKAADVGRAYAEASPQARQIAQQAMKVTREEGLNPNSASFLNALRQATNKSTPSSAEELLGVMTPLALTGMNALTLPLLFETDKDGKSSSNSESEKDAVSEETIMGMTPEEWGSLTQREQYNKSLEDQDLRNYYQQTYGDNLVGNLGYEYFRDLGEASDYSGKHDLVRDLFGYNRDDEGNSQYGISGWQDLAADSINGLKDMDDEAAINAILDYMWGAGNIIDPYQYIQDQAYQAAHSLGSADASNYMGQYFGNNYFNGPDVENFLGTVTDPNGQALYEGLDNADLGAWVMAGDLMNQNLSGFTDEDMAKLTKLLGNAGDNATFGFTDSGNVDRMDWNSDKNRSYSVQSLMETLGQNANGMGDLLNIYNGIGNESNPLISANLADDLMAYIQEQTGREVGRKS